MRTGDLLAANTGPCSSVYENQDFDTYLSDDYWVSQTGGALTGKSLFTALERGDVDGNYLEYMLIV